MANSLINRHPYHRNFDDFDLQLLLEETEIMLSHPFLGKSAQTMLKLLQDLDQAYKRIHELEEVVRNIQQTTTSSAIMFDDDDEGELENVQPDSRT